MAEKPSFVAPFIPAAIGFVAGKMAGMTDAWSWQTARMLCVLGFALIVFHQIRLWEWRRNEKQIRDEADAKEAEREFSEAVAPFGRQEKSIFLVLMRAPDGLPPIASVADEVLRIARPLVFHDVDADRIRLRPKFTAMAAAWTKVFDREREILAQKIAMVRQVNPEMADKLERENT